MKKQHKALTNLFADLTVERHDQTWWDSTARRCADAARHDDSSVVHTDDSDVTIARRRREMAEDFEEAGPLRDRDRQGPKRRPRPVTASPAELDDDDGVWVNRKGVAVWVAADTGAVG